MCVRSFHYVNCAMDGRRLWLDGVMFFVLLGCDRLGEVEGIGGECFDGVGAIAYSGADSVMRLAGDVREGVVWG